MAESETDTGGSATSQKSARAAVRANKPVNYWPARAKPIQYGREQFRFKLSRTARKLPTLNIDPWVETVNWERSGSSRTGEMNFRRPIGANEAGVIANGDMVLCEWAQWGGNGPWAPLWQMKIATPSHQILEGIFALTLTSTLGDAAKSKVAWKFRVDHAHPHGWTADQMTRHVCRRFHLPLGHLPKGKYRIKKYAPKSASPVDVITWAWKQERANTNRRFDVDTSAGVVNVIEHQEPQFLLILGAAMADATVTASISGIASAVTATATRKASGRRKASKLRTRVVDKARRDRYGYIVKTLTAPAGIDSVAELRKWAKNQLANLFNFKRDVQFTHPGMPLVDRGTPLQLYLPEADLKEIVFVTDSRHDLSAGSYTMDLTVNFSDPWTVDQTKEDTAKKKKAVADKRKRTGTSAPSPPKPKKAASRSYK
jgi:hypothetical protein